MSIYVLEYFDDIESGDLVADKECGHFGSVGDAQAEANRIEGCELEWFPETEREVPYAYTSYPAGYVVRRELLGVIESITHD